MYYLPTRERGNMAKAINVKVARTKVIKALEVKVEEMKNQQMNFDLAYAKFESDYADWKNKVAQIAYAHLDSVKDKQKTICVRNAWHNDDNIRVDVEIEIPKDKLPAEPEAPKNPFQTSGCTKHNESTRSSC